jgi:hypothetical protein
MTSNDYYDERQHDYALPRRAVLKSIPLVAGVAGLGGFGAIGSVAASSHTSSTYLWGVQQTTGKVYQIDAEGTSTSPQAATEVVDLAALASSAGISMSFSASSPNGNAYDVEENRFYATTFPGQAKLYFVDLDDASPSLTLAGSLNGAAASGTIYADDTGKYYYYVENGTDNLKRVTLNPDGTVGGETKVGDVAGNRGMTFGDIAFSPDGILYISAGMGGNFNGTWDPDTGTLTEFDLVKDDKYQISFAQDATLYLHQTGTGKFYELDESGTDPVLVELPFSTATAGEEGPTLTLTDLTGNKRLSVCEDCTADGQLAKYEYVFSDDGDIVDSFVLDGAGVDAISYAGDYESKNGEMGEPMSVTFDTEYCEVYALVKAGQEFSVQHLVAEDGSVTAEYVAPYAISFVAFYCTEDAAQAAADAFPSNGAGGGRPDDAGRPDSAGPASSGNRGRGRGRGRGR